VLLARTAPGFANASMRWKTCRLTPISSNTASITRSAVASSFQSRLLRRRTSHASAMFAFILPARTRPA